MNQKELFKFQLQIISHNYQIDNCYKEKELMGNENSKLQLIVERAEKDLVHFVQLDLH